MIYHLIFLHEELQTQYCSIWNRFWSLVLSFHLSMRVAYSDSGADDIRNGKVSLSQRGLAVTCVGKR